MSADKYYQAYGGPIARIPLDAKIKPVRPQKRINDGEDLQHFLASSAHRDVTTFIRQLNHALFPRNQLDESNQMVVNSWPTTSHHIIQSSRVMKIRVLIQTLQSMISEAPPDQGPRRFGNIAFKKWFKLVQDRLPDLLQLALHNDIWHHVENAEKATLKEELAAYLLESLGSPQRLDYGTGHELSFIAFLAAVWRLNGFAPSESGNEERGIVVGVIEPYLDLVRRLILTYTLEPAGSHGVWGLDDHAFIPYLFGSAQVASLLRDDSALPLKGSLHGAPLPAAVIDQAVVKQQAGQNFYFAAIKFIYDVKRGPFWEHSPTLYDISGIKDGWSKINQGLLKMYNAAVLGKFPVVQHFLFGSLLSWERDPSAVVPPYTPHTSSHVKATQTPTSMLSSNGRSASTMGGSASASYQAGTTAPWASQRSAAQSGSDPWTRVPSTSRQGPTLNNSTTLRLNPEVPHRAAEQQ